LNAVSVEVEDEAWTEALADAEAIVERAALAALSSRPPGEMEITVLLTDDATIRALNARFRDKDAATNVLSFPAPEFARPHLGDLALAFGTCAAEAKAQDKALADHLSHLTVHGVLHLLGYDHEADDEAEVMEQMERTILKTLGVGDPYAQGPDA
jgi:probable rRNA maturation factor